MTDKPECYWGLMRVLSLRSRPKCDPPKWKVTVAKDAPILAGKTIHLCDYHKKNLLLTFTKTEKVKQ